MNGGSDEPRRRRPGRLRLRSGRGRALRAVRPHGRAGRRRQPRRHPNCPPAQSLLAYGLPAGVAFDELVSGRVDELPAAPAVLRLERLTFAPGAATGVQEASGPEILYVEEGGILVAD